VQKTHKGRDADPARDEDVARRLIAVDRERSMRAVDVGRGTDLDIFDAPEKSPSALMPNDSRPGVSALEANE
jgi:hypothetical protein